MPILSWRKKKRKRKLAQRKKKRNENMTFGFLSSPQHSLRQDDAQGADGSLVPPLKGVVNVCFPKRKIRPRFQLQELDQTVQILQTILNGRARDSPPPFGPQRASRCEKSKTKPSNKLKNKTKKSFKKSNEEPLAVRLALDLMM